MPNTLGIRRRIRSVKNTRQITKAMELVAATKMRRAQQQALKTRTYSTLVWDMVNNLADKIHVGAHRLLRQPLKLHKVAIVLISSNRGLAGSFNSQIITAALQLVSALKSENNQVQIDLLALGRKAAEAMIKNHLAIYADFEKADVNLQIESLIPLNTIVTEKFSSGEYDRVLLVYSDFVSTLVQKASVKQLLPFAGLPQTQNIIAETDIEDVVSKETDANIDSELDFIFEPNADAVLEKLLPRLVEMQIFQAVLETNASEHSARMVAMKSATDAAGDIISDLTLQYNQLRQAAITQEIAEISAGRLAVT